MQPTPCTAQPVVKDDFFRPCSGARHRPHEVRPQLKRLVPDENMWHRGCCSRERLCSGQVQLPFIQTLSDGGVLEDSPVTEASRRTHIDQREQVPAVYNGHEDDGEGALQ